MSTSDDHNKDDNVLIGEYALHLLNADERRVVDQRLLNEPALRQMLVDWDENLASLADEIPDVTPPPGLKSKINARLFSDATSNTSLWGWLKSRPAFGFAFAALLALVVIFGQQYFEAEDTYTHIAQLEAAEGGLIVQASYDVETANLAVHKIEGVPADGRSFELWLIPNGSTAPVSLGVLSSAEHRKLVVSEDLRAGMVGGTLAISDEPLGGSPTGAPTGAVLAAGQVTHL